jgi:hypothetical protein
MSPGATGAGRAEAERGLFGRLFGVRSAPPPREPERASSPPPDRPATPPAPAPAPPPAARPPAVVAEAAEATEAPERGLGQQVNTGFRDLSRLVSAIHETLSHREGQVQQTRQALPGFLQQVPRIHRAEIECLAQISKQLEHMGGGTREVLARLEGVPDLLRTIAVGQAEQSRFLDGLQARLGEHLEVQAKALREGLEQARRQSEAQLAVVKSMATTQSDVFSTFQSTQNRALNVFHRAQQQSIAQNRETQKVMARQIEVLVDRVHSAQTRVFWLSIGFAALAATGLLVFALL